MRKGDFPPLVIPVADEGGFTSYECGDGIIQTVPLSLSVLGRGPGFCLGPLIPGRDLNSMLPADT